MMHKSPVLKLVCLLSWIITAVVSIGVGATPFGWNILAGWLMSMPFLYYVILLAGLTSLAGMVMHLSSPECH